MTQRQVFISFSHNDYLDEHDEILPDSKVKDILDVLYDAQIKYWNYFNEDYAGHPIESEIIEEIKRSDILLFISSEESNNSVYTEGEIKTARLHNKLIIPVRIDNTEFSDIINFYIKGNIDRIEYYMNPKAGLKKIVTNIKKEFKRLDEIERKKQEEEAIKAKQKEEEENARRAEEEEKKRIATAKKKLDQTKTKIKGFIDKGNIEIPKLIALEKELDCSYGTDTHCPVCGVEVGVGVEDVEKNGKDFCETCGWFFMTPEERVSDDKKQHYQDRLEYSKIIWQKKEELEVALTSKKEELSKKDILISELQSENSSIKKESEKLKIDVSDHKKKIVQLEREIDQLEKETDQLKREKDQLEKETDQLKREKNSGKPDFAYILAEEFGQPSIYRLREGINTFGSISKSDNSDEFYQMIVSSSPIQPKHFTIRIDKKGKKSTMVLEPYSSDCAISLNNKNQQIGSATKVGFNDILYIGELKLTVLDVFNK